MLGGFVFPVVSQWDGYEELIFMQKGAPTHLRFQFVLCFETILLVGGLGVTDKPHVFCVICFCGFGPRRKAAARSEELVQLTEILFLPCSFLKEKIFLCVFHTAEVYGKCGVKFKFGTE
jgi:hypothetical protein